MIGEVDGYINLHTQCSCRLGSWLHLHFCGIWISILQWGSWLQFSVTFCVTFITFCNFSLYFFLSVAWLHTKSQLHRLLRGSLDVSVVVVTTNLSLQVSKYYEKIARLRPAAIAIWLYSKVFYVIHPKKLWI